jgi:ribonuclease-3
MPDLAAEQALAARIGISFANPLLLRLALTHRSVLQDWTILPEIEATLQSNERLEFLGDALLGAIVAEYLYYKDSTADEGALTRRRVAIVRGETLVRWARELDLPDCLYLGTGERVTESVRDRMLAGAFEALIGAIYLDQGRDVAERFVLGMLERDSQAISESERDSNPKGRLQEILQDRAILAPIYETITAAGPDHAREFTEAVIVEGRQLGVGTGRSKRMAQQEAARQAILALEATDKGLT